MGDVRWGCDMKGTFEGVGEGKLGFIVFDKN